MQTPASIKKHPLHPLLVALPIGLWIFSLAGDVILKCGWGGENWHVVALYCMGGGIVTALLAALPGFADLFSLHDPKLKRLGIFHMLIMLLSVGIFAVDFCLRWKGTTHENLPFALSIIGVLVVFIGGWIGGELVHVYRVSVSEETLASEIEMMSRKSPKTEL
jgi:uncharacterized membrane protein